jgi:hypothetical protein
MLFVGIVVVAQKTVIFRCTSGPEHNALEAFSDNSLSDFLSPKPAVSDRRFQLQIDNVVFLGHPTSLTNPSTISSSSTAPFKAFASTGGMQRYSRHIQQSRAALAETSSDSTRLLTTFNIVFCFVESGTLYFLTRSRGCYSAYN